MENGDDMDTALDGSVTRRACEPCRARKVRCNRAVPCSNCKAIGMTCTTSSPAIKQHRERVHVTKKYEEKIDRIEDRLANIELVLQKFTTKLNSLEAQKESPESGVQLLSSRVAIGARRSPISSIGTPPVSHFEGETAINSQGDYARELLAKAVGNTPSIGQNAAIQSALSALQHLVSRQGQVAAPSRSRNYLSVNSDVDPETLDRPPWSAVSDMLNISAKRLAAFGVVWPFLSMPNMREITQDAYENPEECGVARRVLVYGTIYQLFSGYAAFPDQDTDLDAYRSYAAMCQAITEIAMGQLDIFVPASHENIMAFVVGATCAIEMCKPSLCWMMISSAAGMCQELGYHRITSMKNDSKEDRNAKVQLFWMIYSLDKTLSLRHGRASVIQDWDISLPFSIPNSTDGVGDRVLAYWIKVARVQGQTYEKLFSPAGQLQGYDERARIAAELVLQLNEAWVERSEARLFGSSNPQNQSGTLQSGYQTSPNDTELPSQRAKRRTHPSTSSQDSRDSFEVLYERIDDMLFHTDAVLHYSISALIQRAASPDKVTFNQECLESSRAALKAHMRCNEQFNIEGNEELYSGYMNWSVLHAPFTPFMVLFCNVIQNANTKDLTSLSHFVDSIESCRAISEGSENLYKMCHLFLQVAKLYIQAEKQDGANTSLPHSTPNQTGPYTTTDVPFEVSAIAEFDPYLSALGLGPNSAHSIDGFTGLEEFSHNAGEVVDPAISPGMSSAWPAESQQAAQDWFWGSRYLMNLMEAGKDDLPMPDLEF